MIQPAPTTRVSTAQSVTKLPRLWGLSVRDIHRAFWNARGVQCVRLGQREPLRSGAEIFLLIEPDQLVMFNVAELSERLTWHDALVTRLRLINEDVEPYSERVMLDQRGLVECIERRYHPTVHESHRVTLTTRRRVAALWMASGTRREGWNRVRRSVPWSRVDHAKLNGQVFREGSLDQERRLLDVIVERWARPDQAIDGIEQFEPGVWHRRGEGAREDAVRIGPLWLGDGRAADSERCLVGPSWLGDGVGTSPESAWPATVLEIAEVVLPEGEPRHRSTGSSQVYPFIKRSMDFLASAAGLVLLSPLLFFIAFLIALEDGQPIFFGHLRQGRGGRLFRCWKFRTMHRNAEKIARDLEAYNVCDGPQVYIPSDPRVTRIGRILRAAHLDELPQLWNVLVGQMSLVGPRPSPDDENQFCPAWRDTRLSVRPGITGLWQLNRTREPGEDFQEWIKFDIEYVRRASLWLDLTIMAKTVGILLFGRRESANE